MISSPHASWFFIEVEVDLSGKFVSIKGSASAGQSNLCPSEVGMAQAQELDGVELMGCRIRVDDLSRGDIG